MSLVLPRSRATFMPGWVRNDLWRLARAVPSLDLQFADRKSLVDAVTGSNLVTFTRASDATYIGSDGLLKTATTNEPRFDHNPLTGECLGLLVEEQRTNLLLRSEEFDDASWAKSNSTIDPNAITAPNGTLTADKQTHTGSAPRISRFPAATVSAGAQFAVSFYAKAGTSSFAAVSIYDGTITGNRFWFNLVTGNPGDIADIGSGYSAATSSMQSVGDGWYRCVAVITNGANTIVNIDGISVCLDTNGVLTPSVSGLYGYLWGAQLEVGAFPTSYIPTTGSAATRAADVVSITGANFSRWYRQDEGTVFVRADQPQGLFGTVCEFYQNSTNFITIRSNTPNIQGVISVAGVNEGVVNVANATRFSGGFGYAVNNVAFSVNGQSPTVDSSSAMTTSLDTFWIGRRGAASDRFMNGTIARLTYWPTRLPNATLQAITL